MKQIRLVLDMNGPKPRLKQRSDAMKPLVDRLRIRRPECLHCFGKTRALGPNQQVIVIRHQAIGDDNGLIGEEMFPQPPQKELVVSRFKKDLLPIHTSIVDMVILAFDEARLTPRHALLPKEARLF